ncbi:hypothetical protein LINPERHAP2_LOCUS19764 [Linum perenne]
MKSLRYVRRYRLTFLISLLQRLSVWKSSKQRFFSTFGNPRMTHGVQIMKSNYDSSITDKLLNSSISISLISFSTHISLQLEDWSSGFLKSEAKEDFHDFRIASKCC